MVPSDLTLEQLRARGDATTVDGTVDRVSRSFVIVELPAPYAPASFPYAGGALKVGQTVSVVGLTDPQLDLARTSDGDETMLTGLRVMAIDAGSGFEPVSWPETAPCAKTIASAPAEEDDWSEL